MSAFRLGKFLLRIVLIILSLALAPLSVVASGVDDRDCPQLIHTEIVAQSHAAPAAIALHCGAGVAVAVLADTGAADHRLSAGRRLAMAFANWSFVGRPVTPDLPPPVIPTAA